MMKRIFKEEWGFYYSHAENIIPEGMPINEILLDDEKVTFIQRGVTEYNGDWDDKEAQKNFKPKLFFTRASYYKDGKYSYFVNNKPRKIDTHKYFYQIYTNMHILYNKLIYNDERKTVGSILQSFLEINYPYLKDYVDFKKEYQGYYNPPYFPDFSRKKMTYTKIEQAFEYCLSLPKSIKKLLLSSSVYRIIEVHAFSYVGIKDTNILYSLVKNDKVSLFDNRKAQKYYLKCLKDKYGNKAEVIFAKRILNLSKNIHDTSIYWDMFKFLNTYLFIKSKNGEHLKEITNDEIATWTIKKLHDELFHTIRDSIALYHNPDFKEELEMTEERKSFDNIMVQGVNFIVPKTYQEFSNLSDVFHNCVVTYYGMAKKNYCHIISAFKDDKPFACIELSSDKTVRQCLAVGNKKLKNEDMDICKEYFDLIGASEFRYYNNYFLQEEEELPF